MMDGEKQATGERRQADVSFISIVNATPMGIHLYELQDDDSLVFIGANPAASQILGIDHKEFIGLSIEEAFPGLMQTEAPQRYRDAARFGTSWRTEHFDYNDGKIQGTFEIVAFKVGPQKLAVMFNDITARKRSEDALRESEQEFRQLFEMESDAIVLIDNQTGRMIEANRAAAVLYGFNHDELIAMKNSDLSAEPEETQRVTQGMPVVVDNVVTIPLRWHQKKDGTVFPVEITGRFFERHGRSVHIAAIRDITERMKAEEEKGRLQAQLLQAQKMESVGRLAGGVAHDFNNMLGIILGYAELVQGKLVPDDPINKGIQEIINAVNRSDDLTRQLLAFARKQIVSPKVLDLNDTVAGMIKMLRRLIGEEIELAWRPGPAVWPVRADPSQIDQILANLCVNARDAITGCGIIAIETANLTFDTVQAGELSDVLPGDYVVLTVSDDGCGMEKDVLDNIFEPFFTTKGLGQGTGLGLSTVYGIVKQNNGFVDVHSQYGMGTTFKVFLPRYLDKSVHAAEVVQAEDISGGPEKVLFVEDEPIQELV